MRRSLVPPASREVRTKNILDKAANFVISDNQQKKGYSTPGLSSKSEVPDSDSSVAQQPPAGPHSKVGQVQVRTIQPKPRPITNITDDGIERPISVRRLKTPEEREREALLRQNLLTIAELDSPTRSPKGKQLAPETKGEWGAPVPVAILNTETKVKTLLAPLPIFASEKWSRQQYVDNDSTSSSGTPSISLTESYTAKSAKPVAKLMNFPKSNKGQNEKTIGVPKRASALASAILDNSLQLDEDAYEEHRLSPHSKGRQIPVEKVTESATARIRSIIEDISTSYQRDSKRNVDDPKTDDSVIEMATESVGDLVDENLAQTYTEIVENLMTLDDVRSPLDIEKQIIHNDADNFYESHHSTTSGYSRQLKSPSTSKGKSNSESYKETSATYTGYTRSTTKTKSKSSKATGTARNEASDNEEPQEDMYESEFEEGTKSKSLLQSEPSRVQKIDSKQKRSSDKVNRRKSHTIKTTDEKPTVLRQPHEIPAFEEELLTPGRREVLQILRNEYFKKELKKLMREENKKEREREEVQRIKELQAEVAKSRKLLQEYRKELDRKLAKQASMNPSQKIFYLQEDPYLNVGRYTQIKSVGAPYFKLNGNFKDEDEADDPEDVGHVAQLIRHVMDSNQRMYLMTVQAATQMSVSYKDAIRKYKNRMKMKELQLGQVGET